MIKIQLSPDIDSWYISEIIDFFRRSHNHSYNNIESIIKKDLGISFKILLVMKPSELIRIAGFIKISLPNIDKNTKGYLIDVYKSYRNTKSSKNHLKKINLKVCPYCNRNYIFNFGKKSESATAQMDHFYDKSKYPYLSLCLYNLVPCCSTCNLRKSNKDVLSSPILNPFEDNLHNHITFDSSTILSIEEIDDKTTKDIIETVAGA